VEPVKEAAEPQFPTLRVERIWGYRLAGIVLSHELRDRSTHGGVEMKIEHKIDELIKAGWGVLDSDFDPVAFQHWRVKAFECLNAMFGSDHTYTKYFERFVKQGDRANILAAGGVLVAAKEQWAGNEFQPSAPRDALESAPVLIGTAGDSKRRSKE